MQPGRPADVIPSLDFRNYLDMNRYCQSSLVLKGLEVYFTLTNLLPKVLCVFGIKTIQPLCARYCIVDLQYM